MMKKLLLACTMLMAGMTMMNAQNIGIIGDATPGEWDYDVDMVTTDNVIYTLENFVLEAGSVKFRENDAWTNNWGGATWPSGTGVLSGSNIPSQPGIYNITFNRTTLEYNFEDAGNFDDVSLMVGATTFSMFTIDGVNYSVNNVVVESEATATFSVNGSESWGGADFPSGTATSGGAAISIPVNSYNVTYNMDTHAYAFNFVMISITGDAVGGWGNVDVDMATTDGVNYSVEDVVFTAAEWKFRLNHDWGTTWGNATFPSGTVTVVGDGGNILATAGTYDGTFNRVTGAFAFTESTTGSAVFNATAITAYPNPAQTAWTINAGAAVISNVQLCDITGKVVLNLNGGASVVTVNGSTLANGVYFARVTAGEAVTAIKLVKN